MKVNQGPIVILTALVASDCPRLAHAECASQSWNHDIWFEAAGDVITLPFADLVGMTFFVTDQYAEFGVLFTEGDDFLVMDDEYRDGVGLNGFWDTTVLEFDTPIFWAAADMEGCEAIQIYSGKRLIYDTLGACEDGFAGVGSTVSIDKVVLFGPGGGPVIDNFHFSRTPITIDCDDNGIADLIEVGYGCESAPDCNDNLVPDECDVAAGIAEDCDDNGVLDECEVSFPHSAFDSAAPFSGPLPELLKFDEQPLSGSDVEITITLSADLDEFAEFIWIEFEGDQVTDFLFMEDGQLCADPPELIHLTLTAEQFNAYLADDGEFHIFVVPTLAVDAVSCPESFVAAELSYFTFAKADLDYNSIPDACQGDSCPADLDASGGVGFSDLLLLLNAWNSDDPGADLDDSGVVGFGDLLLLLNDWGPCA